MDSTRRCNKCTGMKVRGWSGVSGEGGKEGRGGYALVVVVSSPNYDLGVIQRQSPISPLHLVSLAMAVHTQLHAPQIG